MLNHRASQSGQIGIIIILIMVVLLTVGLSLASRSTREVRLSQQEVESNRVFNVAEAGIEQALSSDFSFQGEEYHPAPTTVPGTNATVDYNIRKNHILETRLSEGVGARVQLKDTTTPTPGSVNIEWSTDKSCTITPKPASIIVSVYTVDSSVVPADTKVRHFAYAACDQNDGVAVAGNGSGTYFKSVNIPLQARDEFIRVKPMYNDTSLRVSAPVGTLPVQYYTIRSSATNDLGTENRIVEVNRTLPVAPSIMDYVVFSGTTLVK
jgi:Tfp pilus assembly protein PilX